MIAAVDQKNINGPVRYVRFLEVPISPQIRYKPLHLFDRMTLEQWEWHSWQRAASHHSFAEICGKPCRCDGPCYAGLLKGGGGAVIKRADSSYIHNRSNDWIKQKRD